MVELENRKLKLWAGSFYLLIFIASFFNVRLCCCCGMCQGFDITDSQKKKTLCVE